MSFKQFNTFRHMTLSQLLQQPKPLLKEFINRYPNLSASKYLALAAN